MQLHESIRSACNSIQAHQLRSFLTSLGIIVGVAAIIALVSLIQGFSRSIESQFENMGSSALTIRAKNDFKDVLIGKKNYLSFQDLDYIERNVSSISQTSPMFSLGAGTLRYGTVSTPTTVFAASPVYQQVQRRFPAKGRFLSESDEASARRVAVIGPKPAQTLRLPEDPVGSYVFYASQWFKVIGVMEERGELFGISQDDYLIVPYRTGQTLIGNDQKPDMVITVSLKEGSEHAAAKEQLRMALRMAHRLDAKAPDDFEVLAADYLAASLSKLAGTLSFVMFAVIGIALLVGGIGIMNIMLVSVTERTREIGICKALGATRTDITMQFMVEALVISIGGGGLGILLGTGSAFLLCWIIPAMPTAIVPGWAILLALLFSTVIGLVFGIVPASKAGALDAVVCLRHE